MCGFAFWMTDGSGDKQLMFVDTAPGGKKIALLSSYRNSKMEIVSVGLPWDLVEDEALRDTGTTNYSYIDALILGIEKTFRISLTSKTFGEVCSEFVARILSKGGINVRHDIDPNSLYKSLQAYQSETPIRVNC